MTDVPTLSRSQLRLIDELRRLPEADEPEVRIEQRRHPSGRWAETVAITGGASRPQLRQACGHWVGPFREAETFTWRDGRYQAYGHGRRTGTMSQRLRRLLRRIEAWPAPESSPGAADAGPA
jgi:hypothetical protein